jgi:hypothetical protein
MTASLHCSPDLLLQLDSSNSLKIENQAAALEDRDASRNKSMSYLGMMSGF